MNVNDVFKKDGKKVIRAAAAQSQKVKITAVALGGVFEAEVTRLTKFVWH